MSVFAAASRYLFTVSAVLALTACGGGGGGGGGSNDAYSVSPTGVTFVATQNGPVPSPQQANVSVNSGIVYIRVETTGAAVASANFVVTGTTTGTITINPVSPTMSPGTYSGTVTVYGCADQFCTSSVAGSPKVINVTYTIQPRTGLSATPQSLSFSQLQSAAPPAPQTLALSDIAGGSYAWNASINYISGSGWLTVNNSGSTNGASLPMSLSVGINPLSSMGTYSAVIRVSGNGNNIDIPVSYTVRVPLVTAAPTSLTFSAVSHDSATPATQSVTLSTEASLPVSYSAVVVYGAGASGWLTAPATGSAPSSMTVGVNTTGLNAGTYTATLRLTTATQNLSIGVTYLVRAPQVTRSPTQLSFSSFRQGATPSAQSVTINTENSISVPYTTNISYGIGASGWLNLPASGTAPGGLSASVNTTNLNAGIYTATITVLPGYGATSFTVGVTYQVQNATLTLTPAQLSYTITNNSTSADLTRTVAVGDSGISLGWSAVASVPWLSVGTASGTTLGNGTTVAVSMALVSSELEELRPGSYTGNVTFSYTRPDTSVGTMQVAVTLNMNVPLLNFVAPYVAIANTTNTFIVRGQGFTGLTANEILFGSTSPSTINVVSDTEIRGVLGALTAQSYPVTISNQLGLNRSRANLVVVAPNNYAAVFFTSAGTKTRVVFDDERRAVYVVNRGTLTLERYLFDSGTATWVSSSLSLPQLQDAGLSTDGTQLVAVSDGAVRVLDPSSLTQTQQIAFGTTTSSVHLRQITFANNGKALLATGIYGSGFTPLYLYDMLETTVTPIQASSYFAGTANFAPLGGSSDGARIVFGDSGVSPAQPVRYYNASTGTLIVTGTARNVSRVVLDRDATRVVLNQTEVFDSNLAYLGSLPSTTGAVVLSPNGTIAYTYDGLSGQIRKFDLNGALVAGIYPEVGIATVPVGAPISTAYPVMGISRDGNTLVVAGDQKVVIMPAP